MDTRAWRGLLLCGVFSLLVTTGGCSRLCETETLQRLTSPDGQLDAVVFTRNCGATTDYETAVALRGPGDGPPSTRRNDVFRVRGYAPPEVEWSGDTLVIMHGPGARIEAQRGSSHGKTIRIALRR